LSNQAGICEGALAIEIAKQLDDLAVTDVKDGLALLSISPTSSPLVRPRRA